MVEDDNSRGSVSLDPAFYCEPLITIILLLNQAIHYSKLDLLIVQVETELTESDHKAIVRFSKVLVILCLVYWIAAIIFSIINVSNIAHPESLGNLLLLYRALHLPNIYIRPYLMVNEILYTVLTAAVHFYFALMAVIYYMLYLNFRRLNTILNSRDHIRVIDIKEAQVHHQQLATLVRNANAVFSPSLLILFCIKTLQIITGVNVLKTELRLHRNNENNFLSIVLLYYLSAIGIIIILTLVGGKIYNEVRATNY